MISKNTLLSTMLRECDIITHLHGKLPAGSLDFRFTPGQRSTLELLQYLSYVGLGATHGMLDGNFEKYGALAKAAEDLAPAGFPAAMGRQKDALVAVFETLTDDDLATRKAKLPWGMETTLGEALLLLPSACLVAYRMQLFLHAKAAGADKLSTSNCWGGMDAPPGK